MSETNTQPAGLVRIGTVTDVQPHPNSNTLDIVTIAGKVNVANRPDPERARYRVGDYAAVFGPNLLLPDDLIKHMKMWNHAKDKGGLEGGKGNRTKARKVADVLSEVALCAVEWERGPDRADDAGFVLQQGVISVMLENGKRGRRISQGVVGLINTNDPTQPQHITPDGVDVTFMFDVTAYVPPS